MPHLDSLSIYNTKIPLIKTLKVDTASKLF